jgi:hypothetical protein
MANGSDQSVIQQMLDKLKVQLNDPSSSIYLPTVIKQAGYDPFTPKDPWSMDSLPAPGGTIAAKNICTGVFQSKGEFGIPTPTAPLPSLLVTDSTGALGPTVTGASNMLVTSMLAGGSDGRTITVQTYFSANILVSGNFVLTQSCCQTSDHKTCAGSPESEVGKGTAVATLGVQQSPPPITVVQQISQLGPNLLTFVVESVQYQPDPSTLDIQAKVIDLPDYWQQSVDEVLGNVQTKQAIIQQINVQLVSSGFLQTLGTQLTTRIDQYLKDNHMYPFNGSFLSLF